MSSLIVAAGQYSASADPVQNLALAAGLVAEAADEGAQLIAFPEGAMAAFDSPLRDLAEPIDGRYATGIRELAARHSLTIVTGMFTPGEGARVRNTLLATGPDGEWTYDKIHLFDAFGSRESDLVEPGEQLVTFDLHGIRIGLATCYDVRFADQFTALGQAGADLVVLPASWGSGPGKVEQWQILTAARALDSQAWLLAAGQAYTEPRGKAALGIGYSALIDPLGHVHSSLTGEQGLLVGEVDPAVVGQVRTRIPVLSSLASRTH